MIPITVAPEPANFFALVESPGRRFLADTPTPTQADWERHPYWRRCADDLHKAYKGVCCYTSHYVHLDTGGRSVDHFLPKKHFPNIAYRWTNLRLACQYLNSRKSSKLNIVDPFVLKPGAFELSFPSMIISVRLPSNDRQHNLCVSTIKELGLNDERILRARLEYAVAYAAGEINRSYLEKRAPFIASEIDRQNIDLMLKSIMGQ